MSDAAIVARVLREHAKKQFADPATDDMTVSLAVELAEAQAGLAAARSALEPFEAYAREIDAIPDHRIHCPDDATHMVAGGGFSKVKLTFGDFRRVIEAFDQLSPSAPARDCSAAVPAQTVEPERAGGEAAQEPAGQSEASGETVDRDAIIDKLWGIHCPGIRQTPEDRAFYGNVVDTVTAALLPAGSASPGVTEEVKDTWLVGGHDLKAMSGSVESDRIIQLHFRRRATDEDRKWLLAAINEKIASAAHPTVKVSGDAAEWRTDFENAPKRDAEGRMVEIMIAGGTFYDSMSMSSTPLPFNGWTLACWDGSEWRGENCGGHDEFYYHRPTHWMPKIAGPLTQEGRSDV